MRYSPAPREKPPISVVCPRPFSSITVARQGDNTDGTRAVESGTISSTLLDRVKAQEPYAWRRLVQVYGPLVYRWARCSGLADAEADDIVQEVFVAVSRHVAGFRRQDPGDSFHAWLATITRHKIADLGRRREQALAQGGTAAQQRLLEIPEDSLPTTCHQGHETLWHRCLELVRAEFEPCTWQAFWRVAVDGQAPAEVAAELGMNVCAVYKAKSRVLRRAREELAGMEGFGGDRGPEHKT